MRTAAPPRAARPAPPRTPLIFLKSMRESESRAPRTSGRLKWAAKCAAVQPSCGRGGGRAWRRTGQGCLTDTHVRRGVNVDAGVQLQLGHRSRVPFRRRPVQSSPPAVPVQLGSYCERGIGGAA